jgi:hypothetical protein
VAPTSAHGPLEAHYSLSGSVLPLLSAPSYVSLLGAEDVYSSPLQIVGGILTGLLAVFCGWMGERHYIGFTVSSRFSWGMRGSYFPVVLRVFVSPRATTCSPMSRKIANYGTWSRSHACGCKSPLLVSCRFKWSEDHVGRHPMLFWKGSRLLLGPS